MSGFTASGSTFAVSATAPPTYDQAGYEDNSVTYTDIAEIISGSEFGGEAEITSWNTLSNRVTQKAKGNKDAGSVALQLAYDMAASGHSILSDASNSSHASFDTEFTVRITLKNGDKFYNTSLINGYKKNVGGTDDLVGASTQLELLREELFVAAT